MPRLKGSANKKYLKTSGVKSKLMTIRLSVDQYELIKRLSGYYDSTLTDYVLNAVITYARSGYHKTYIQTEELKDLEILET